MYAVEWESSKIQHLLNVIMILITWRWPVRAETCSEILENKEVVSSVCGSHIYNFILYVHIVYKMYPYDWWKFYCPDFMNTLTKDLSTWWSCDHNFQRKHCTPWLIIYFVLKCYFGCYGARDIVIGWGTMLQSGRLQFRFLMWSLNFSIYPIFRNRVLGSSEHTTKMSTKNLLGWQSAVCALGWQPHRDQWADCPENAGFPTSQNTAGIQGAVTGIALLYGNGVCFLWGTNWTVSTATSGQYLAVNCEPIV
jgi:hypothetical protein